MVGNSSFICGGSIIGVMTLLLLQACLPINVAVTIATEDNHYHLHNNKNKHHDYEQQATIISRRRRRRRRRTASNNNNDNVDCAWHADMITRDGCTNDDNCKFVAVLFLMSYSYTSLLYMFISLQLFPCAIIVMLFHD